MSNIIKILIVSVVVGAALANPKLTTAITSYDARPEQAATTTLRGFISRYSAVESCNTARCVMASGRSAYVGAVACPPRFKLGTKVRIAGKLLTCEDRTANWVQKKWPDTFDIFEGYTKEAHQRAIQFGRQRLTVEIL